MFDVESLSAFHFLRPWWLLGLIPLILTVLYAKHLKDPVAQWQKTIAPHLLKALTVQGERGQWLNPISLSVLAMVLGVVAVAGPSWERKPLPFVQDEAPLVVALALSDSMNQTDIQPSRLERAKQKITDLLALRAGSRTGLVVYSGSAHRVIPLTNDPDIIFQFLNAVVTEMMPKPGKFPETVLPVADSMLKDADIPGSLLLIGDGISPQSLARFKQYFVESPHQLLVWGAGLTELPESEQETGSDDESYLPLEEQDLTALATDNGGVYQQMTLDPSDVERLNRNINNHLANVEDENRPWVDAGYYLLFPFALIFLVWFRKGWTLHWCLLLVLLNSSLISSDVQAEQARSNGGLQGVTTSAQEVKAEEIKTEGSEPSRSRIFNRIRDAFMNLWLTPDQQGRWYFERGDYKSAAKHFHDTAWKGIAFYYNEDFKTAAELFTQIDTTEGLFNLANAQAQGQLYLDAVKTYDRVLTQQPTHAGAKKNRDIVQALIDEINQMSKSQQPEEGEAIRELGDEPQRADGAEKEEGLPTKVQQLTAEQILADQQVQDLWMKQIQQDPSRFLSVKFQMQLNQGEGSD